MTSRHGHVVPRADRTKEPCGGPGVCQECLEELAELTKHGNWIKGDQPRILKIAMAVSTEVAAVVGRHVEPEMITKAAILTGLYHAFVVYREFAFGDANSPPRRLIQLLLDSTEEQVLKIHHSSKGET